MVGTNKVWSTSCCIIRYQRVLRCALPPCKQHKLLLFSGLQLFPLCITVQEPDSELCFTHTLIFQPSPPGLTVWGKGCSINSPVSPLRLPCHCSGQNATVTKGPTADIHLSPSCAGHRITAQLLKKVLHVLRLWEKHYSVCTYTAVQREVHILWVMMSTVSLTHSHYTQHALSEALMYTSMNFHDYTAVVTSLQFYFL